MRLLRRRNASADEDEEMVRLMARLANRPRLKVEGAKPSRDAVGIYVDNGLKALEKALRDLGAGEEEVRKALRIGEKVLASNYPNQLDIGELAKQLLARVRTPQRQRHS